MKQVKILFILALCLNLTYSFGQIKVIDGDVLVGPNPSGTPDEAGFKAYGETELELALDAGEGAPDFSLQVNNQTKAAFRYNPNLSGGGLEILCDNASTTNVGMPGTARKIFIHGTSGNVGIGTYSPSERLHVAGNILATGSYMTSDKRLKSNINPFERGLADILKMETYSFQYNGKAGIENTDLQYGLLAQDLKEIAPELVGTFLHKTYEDSEDGETSTLTGEKEYLHINASAIQYMVINAIQEQQQQLEEKKQEIIELKNIVQQLHQQMNDLNTHIQNQKTLGNDHK